MVRYVRSPDRDFRLCLSSGRFASALEGGGGGRG